KQLSYEESRRTRVRSVARGSRLLLLIARRAGGITASEAAKTLGVALPTAYHLLMTLVDEGLVARTAERRYVLGPRVAVLADGFLRDGDTPAYLTGPLRALAAETGETAYLTAWRGA